MVSAKEKNKAGGQQGTLEVIGSQDRWNLNKDRKKGKQADVRGGSASARLPRRSQPDITEAPPGHQRWQQGERGESSMR